MAASSIFRPAAMGAGLACLMALALTAGCAARPEAPVIRPLAEEVSVVTAAHLEALLPADVLLLGEQHDAPEHQKIEQQVIAWLAGRGTLGAVVLEMADAGASTAALRPSSTEEQARRALSWDNSAWPWAAYSPAVMTAVRAGVPVVGANLPRSRMQASMADSRLDVQLPGPALKAQQQLIRTGHCNLLPESQITPMTRIQIARDISMAQTLSQAVLPGKVVVLLSGSAHADRKLGVPQHLPAGVSSKAFRLRARDASGQIADDAEAFDGVWLTPPLPETDYCEKFRLQIGR